MKTLSRKQKQKPDQTILHKQIPELIHPLFSHTAVPSRYHTIYRNLPLIHLEHTHILQQTYSFLQSSHSHWPNLKIFDEIFITDRRVRRRLTDQWRDRTILSQLWDRRERARGLRTPINYPILLNKTLLLQQHTHLLFCSLIPMQLLLLPC